MKPVVYFPFSADGKRLYWDPSHIEKLRTFADVTEHEDAATAWDTVPENVQAIVIGWGAPKLPRRVWESHSGLRIISIFGGSANAAEDPIDALDKGVTIANASREIGEGVAEMALGLIFAAQYKLVDSACAYRNAAEVPDRAHGLSYSLTGATVGIIGLGFVGREFAKLLAPFNVKLLVCDPYVGDDALARLNATRTPLRDLMRDSDVISSHAGWTQETEGMITAELLDLMRPHALLVSTARMPVFDQHALAQRVLSGKVRFASDLIAADNELWSDENLRSCANLIRVPGHTSITDRTTFNMGARVVEDLERFFSGRPPVNRVTADWIRHTT